ncbi:MAG TPA: hypothetical protein VJN19_03190 [Propionibacteriaceae bacterium]|nr:hypothetical protein [Propionibacteriaceae bacterium]
MSATRQHEVIVQQLASTTASRRDRVLMVKGHRLAKQHPPAKAIESAVFDDAGGFGSQPRDALRLPNVMS